MKVRRSETTLTIELPEDGERVEIIFPNIFRMFYRSAKAEIVADDLKYLIGALEHHLARLASNAIDAEVFARQTGNPRWLVYDAETGHSYETSYEVEGFPRVEYQNGRAVWINTEGGNE
jgi:hypothetical protein